MRATEAKGAQATANAPRRPRARLTAIPGTYSARRPASMQRANVNHIGGLLEQSVSRGLFPVMRPYIILRNKVGGAYNRGTRTTR